MRRHVATSREALRGISEEIKVDTVDRAGPTGEDLEGLLEDLVDKEEASTRDLPISMTCLKEDSAADHREVSEEDLEVASVAVDLVVALEMDPKADSVAALTEGLEDPWEVADSEIEVEATLVDPRAVEEATSAFMEMITIITKALTEASVDPIKASSPT